MASRMELWLLELHGHLAVSVSSTKQHRRKINTEIKPRWPAPLLTFDKLINAVFITSFLSTQVLARV